ncbi:MAG: ATP-binding cassette domain-containing protein [Lachnospiraceae bacterium]|nr:ATP-binding cassette domain-containing protein [Lachnospiraceae bacterium]
MIEIRDLTKIYKLSNKRKIELKTKDTHKVAVNEVSLTARPGEIYGLLGPNGAGKTTTLRCVATLLKPTKGSISVCGFDTVKNGKEVRNKIGFLTNEIKLDPNFSPDYMFDFFGGLHGIDPETLAGRKEVLFEKFGINEFRNKKIEEFSTGMKQKAGIAVSLVHDPEVIIFDEPTNGLDIITARVVTDFLKELRDSGKTIIVSTHIMSEAEKLCDRIGLIIDGKKVVEGTLPEILAGEQAEDLEDAFFKVYKRTTQGND